MASIHRCLIFFFAIIMFGGAEAQNCKVLKEELAGEYEGECRKGLAHGMGTATGIDSYTGGFKKGLPDGKGVYHYASGDVYEGQMKKGGRHGTGKMTLHREAQLDSTYYGRWNNDKFAGQDIKSMYKIVEKRDCDRVNVRRMNAEENAIQFEVFVRNMKVRIPGNVMLSGSSGVQRLDPNFIGFENITFPFSGSIRYEAPNKTGTSQLEVYVNIELYAPGNWKVSSYH